MPGVRCRVRGAGCEVHGTKYKCKVRGTRYEISGTWPVVHFSGLLGGHMQRYK